MTVGKITATTNPHVKYARRLHRRRVREKEARCLLEGVRLVADAAAAGASLVLCFWMDTMLAVPGGEELLRHLRERPPLGGLYEVNGQVMAELADTETPQGIVAVAQRPSPDPRALLGGGAAGRPAGASTLVVLDNVRDPGNVGTIIRSADASGAAGVVFLPGTADPFGPKALRGSMGSAFHIPVVGGVEAVLAYRAELGVESGAGAAVGRPDRAGPGRPDRATAGWPGRATAGQPDRTEAEENSGDDGGGGSGRQASRSSLAVWLPELLRRRGYRLLVADASAETPHWKAEFGERTALVLGSEAEGPDPVLWEGADRVSIPMLGAAESLNVAMAATVLVYEAARRREGWGR